MTSDASSHDSPQAIFVYGTLRRGGSNHFRMESAKRIGPATVRGALYKVDWYPGLVLDPQGGEVVGDWFEVPADQIPALDDYEGPEYRRIKTTATDDQGKVAEVWIWEWIGPTAQLTPIPDGNWLT